ncbi:MAG: tRNA (adenosine(37)-N6)-dimethylallyltransferase MiaA [Cytophagales bacterium]|nr:tRNA (adenosine(37)-N6)-dimethylallyltransferase MiaA [Cytophagales bacterium]
MSAAPEKYLLSIVGPTASGKTSMAIELAKWLDTEIISADSRQFFKELEIGTAKPTPEELAQAPHHFVNHCQIDQRYDVGQFEREVLEKLEELYRVHKVVIMVGGSGLYCKAVWEGLDEFPEIDLSYREALKNELNWHGLTPLLSELEKADPEYYELVDRQNPQRIIRALEVIRATQQTFTSFRAQKAPKIPRNFKNIKVGIEMPRDVLYARIEHRMDLMIEAGLFDEAREMLPYRQYNALQTVGYTEIFRHFDGEYDREEAVRLLKRNTRRFAKRQFTWFKRDPEIKWYHPDQIEMIKDDILTALNT